MIVRSFAVLAVVVGLAAGQASAQSAPPAASASSAPAATAAPSPAIVVHMKNFVYAPNPAAIAVGQTVLFLNDDATAHTVTADDGSWDSGNMDVGAKFSHTFTKAGTVTYNCAYHGFMHGSVTVK